jgi:hypothetical protein
VRCTKNPEIQYLLDFSPYTDYKLPRPLCELRRRPSTCDNDALDAAMLEKLQKDIHDVHMPHPYKTEGLLGYALHYGGGFFDAILAYNGPEGTSGNARWDKVFDRMKAEGYKQRLVPCMVRISAAFPSPFMS